MTVLEQLQDAARDRRLKPLREYLQELATSSNPRDEDLHSLLMNLADKARALGKKAQEEGAYARGYSAGYEEGYDDYRNADD